MNIALGALLLTAASCSNVDNDGVNFETDLPNAVYLDGLSSTALTKVTLTDEGASAIITPSAAPDGIASSAGAGPPALCRRAR